MIDTIDLILLCIAAFIGGLVACLFVCAIALAARPPRQRRHPDQRIEDGSDLPTLLRRQGY